MDIRQVLKRSDAIAGLVRDSTKLKRLPDIVRRNQVIKKYLASAQTRKLQIGACATSIDGWLSTDIAPQSKEVLFLDATRLFPFDDNIFDYVFSEHMIEHISWPEGLQMLRECKRVLKPGGILRIATPDLEVLVGLYRNNGDPLRDRYIRWITDRYLPNVGTYDTSFVINNAFRNWGHQFLYDGRILAMAMQQAGFTSVTRCASGESQHPHLRKIESHGKNVGDDEMAEFETMVFEGHVAHKSQISDPGNA